MAWFSLLHQIYEPMPPQVSLHWDQKEEMEVQESALEISPVHVKLLAPDDPVKLNQLSILVCHFPSSPVCEEQKF